MPLKLLIADEQRVLRDGLKAIFAAHDEFEVAGECAAGVDAVSLARRLRPDIVLMEVSLTGLNGLEATVEILRHWPDARVLILSQYDDEPTVVGAVKAGARGYVLKRASSTDLMEALRVVGKGGFYLSPQVSDRLVARIQRGNLEVNVTPQIGGLSPRELQVLRLVAEGQTSKDIATVLDLSLQTVRSYRKTMMKKLNVKNVAGLTQLALAAGVTRAARHANAGVA